MAGESLQKLGGSCMGCGCMLMIAGGLILGALLLCV